MDDKKVFEIHFIMHLRNRRSTDRLGLLKLPKNQILLNTEITLSLRRYRLKQGSVLSAVSFVNRFKSESGSQDFNIRVFQCRVHMWMVQYF